MKKILFGILTFLGIGLSFCSASEVYIGGLGNDIPLNNGLNHYYFPGYNLLCGISPSPDVFLSDSLGNNIQSLGTDTFCIYYDSDGFYLKNTIGDDLTMVFPYNYLFNISLGGGGSTPSTSDIDVYYNNGNSVETITCDGTQAIDIKGLSIITSTNTFTPYFNIDYTDEDNQSLTESYSKDILYLSGSTFKKTYTGNNDRILTSQGGDSESIFTGYLPSFDITGSVDPNDEFTGNVFNNFADNSLKVLLSNIPSYIQYVILIALLFFILGFIRKFKRR